MSLQRTSQSVAPFLQFCAALFVAMSFVGGLLPIAARAQDSAEMSAVYGRGVHAYFGNRISAAEQMFSQVVQAGSTDPRVYYFRAMTRLRTGRQHEAEEDMKIGAAYEARDPGSRHSIGIALQRVQGQGRRTLERFRREGRLSRVQQRRQQSRLRYEQLEQRGPHVLRHETPVPHEQPSGPSMPLDVPEASPPPPLPGEAEAEAPLPIPAASSPAEAAPPVPLAVPAADEGDDLFSEPPPVPEDSSDAHGDHSPEAEHGPDDTTEDLFGDPAPTEPVIPESSETNEDPFADPSEPEAAAESNTDPPIPTADEAADAEEEVSEPAGDDDLFGEAASEEEGTETAPPVPESSEEELVDPFEESDSAESPTADSTDAVEEDLFGEATESEDSEAEDPFGEAADSEADESEASEPEEADPSEESSEEESPEETETDDLFGEAYPQESAEASHLAENDKVESNKLLGILGRVAGSTVPWKNFQFPTMNLGLKEREATDANALEGIALGPVPTDEKKVTPASAEVPIEKIANEEIAEEDFFGVAASDTPKTEDPFDDFGDEPSKAAEQKLSNAGDADEETTEVSSEQKTPESEDDDLFGDF